MDAYLLDDFEYNLELDELLGTLHIRPGSEDSRDLEALLKEARQIARPRALYKVTYLDQRSEDSVTISGVELTSRVLRVNLDQAERVFPFVATCGMELHNWAESVTDMIWNYWAHSINEAALRIAASFLHDHIAETYRPGHLSTMSPGSLENWPIQQQTPLFQLLPEATAKAGVQLTPSLLMVPTKSISGIIFPTEGSFESCQLCPRVNCPGRRAPYDETLFEREYCPKVPS